MIVDFTKIFPELLSGDGITILCVFLIIFSIGAISIPNDLLSKVPGLILATITLLLTIELIYSIFTKPNFFYVTKLEKYPIEYREENNTLYVFYNNELHKLNSFTDEYAEKGDTLYVYETKVINNGLYWDFKRFHHLKPLKNVKFLNDSNLEVIQPDTVLLDIDPKGGFVIRELKIDSLITDSLN